MIVVEVQVLFFFDLVQFFQGLWLVEDGVDVSVGRGIVQVQGINKIVFFLFLFIVNNICVKIQEISVVFELNILK